MPDFHFDTRQAVIHEIICPALPLGGAATLRRLSLSHARGNAPSPVVHSVPPVLPLSQLAQVSLLCNYPLYLSRISVTDFHSNFWAFSPSSPVIPHGNLEMTCPPLPVLCPPLVLFCVHPPGIGIPNQRPALGKSWGQCGPLSCGRSRAAFRKMTLALEHRSMSVSFGVRVCILCHAHSLALTLLLHLWVHSQLCTPLLITPLQSFCMC